MLGTKTEPADEIQMTEADFDAIMSKAPGVAALQGDADKPARRLAHTRRRCAGSPGLQTPARCRPGDCATLVLHNA